jgi:hypothetical protein
MQANITEPSPAESRRPLPLWLESRPKGTLVFAFCSKDNAVELWRLGR